jgi:hypothetical protein
VAEHKDSELFHGATDDDDVAGTLNQELTACRFEDVRVGRRFKKLVRSWHCIAPDGLDSAVGVS